MAALLSRFNMVATRSPWVIVIEDSQDKNLTLKAHLICPKLH
jgi:hypothetical protein